MQILIAPNAFKNSLSASEAANAIEKGLRRSTLDCSSECFPIGDGGDGTAALLSSRHGGSTVGVEVSDPLGKKIAAEFWLTHEGRVTVIELAAASGLRLLRRDELDPLHASSFGTGELIKCALERGVSEIILAIGGSATVDGAAGILQALGVRFLNANGNTLTNLPEAFVDLDYVDLSGLDSRILKCSLIVLCDVDNPLLGEQGAARMFGPQKGATPQAVSKLEAALAKLSEVCLRQTGKDMATIKCGGAAGGVAASLQAFLNGKLLNGIEYFLNVTGFDAALDKADLLITGEGSIDDQTLHSKGPIGVATRARAKNIPVIGLGGTVPLQPNPLLQEYFDILLPIGTGPIELEIALSQTALNLERTAFELGNLLAFNGRRVKNRTGEIPG
jgi:glycerate kinase